jgi:hypothetical protein
VDLPRHSDPEVILAAFERGIAAAIKPFVGMFTIAVWMRSRVRCIVR